MYTVVLKKIRTSKTTSTRVVPKKHQYFFSILICGMKTTSNQNVTWVLSCSLYNNEYFFFSRRTYSTKNAASTASGADGSRLKIFPEPKSHFFFIAEMGYRAGQTDFLLKAFCSKSIRSQWSGAGSLVKFTYWLIDWNYWATLDYVLRGVWEKSEEKQSCRGRLVMLTHQNLDL